jgi:diguanylate cyclase (GGDEF)-like protein
VDVRHLRDGLLARLRPRREERMRLEMVHRVLDAIEEYIYVGELLPDDGYELLYQGPCRATFLALDAEAAEAATWAEYVHPDDRELFEHVHRDARVSGLLDAQYRLIDANGQTRWVRDRGRVRFEGGRQILHGSVLDVTEVHEANAALESARAEADRLGRLDPLTGVANRRVLPDLLDRRLAAGDAALGVLLLDIDRFKHINDAYGHAAGDAVLVEVARRVRATVRETDAIARIGGEEFLVLLHGIADRPSLRRVGEAIRTAIASTAFATAAAPIGVTVSIGAALSGDASKRREPLLGAADQALYTAKRRGRDRVVLFSELGSAEERSHDSHELELARAMAAAACAREGISAAHAEEVSRQAAAVAARLGASPAIVARCRIAGLVHDIGKIAVPEGIVLKPGPLSDDEWETMRRHPVLGEDIVRLVPELRDVTAAVRHHHERYDGAGYPDGLAGEAIPLEARVLAAVDAYSAMTADRPYRMALSHEDALGELREAAGSQLDPLVVGALLEVLQAVMA